MFAFIAITPDVWKVMPYGQLPTIHAHLSSVTGISANGRSLAAKAVVEGDNVVSAAGIVPSGTGTSRTQSTSAFTRTFGGTPGDWQIGLLVQVPSQELGKKGMLTHLSPPKPWLWKAFL